jgi:hypothetical protein
MYRNPPFSSKSIPREYRKAAECLFPSEKVQELKLLHAVDFANALGIGSEYQRLLSLGKNSVEMVSYLEHFQNNLDLLIQKTWVDTDEVIRKEKLQDEIPPFMVTIEEGKLNQSIAEFDIILEELAYLFFGSECNNDDFTEYTFRIDTQMGLFWWYCGKLSTLRETENGYDSQILWAILLLGICYLTNF